MRKQQLSDPVKFIIQIWATMVGIRRHMPPELKAAVILSVRQYRQKYAAECGRARADSQFKAGNTPTNGKKAVNLISGSPPPVRDLQKMHANSTNGRIAEASGASRYVVEELAALQKINPQAFAAVAAGEARLKDRRHIHSAGLSRTTIGHFSSLRI